MRRILLATIACPLAAIPSLALAQSGGPAWITPERWNKMLDAAAIETPKLLTTLIFLGLGWMIGKQLTVLWSRRQKQNEQDLDAARDFHALYGEFFALWKLWNYYIRDLGAEALPGASRWQILDRACDSEAKLESTLVRLASEKSLDKKDVETLGRFRQRYQQLRECIRDNVPLEWDHSEHSDYVEFKMLAPQVAAIIVGSGRVRRELLTKITSNIYEVPNRRKRSRVTVIDGRGEDDAGAAKGAEA
jgi:hypothetical protein